MIRYVLKRILFMIPIILGVSVLVFVMLSFSPGDPATLACGLDATPEIKEAWRESNGLNDPLPVQYFNYIRKAVIGDLGQSYISKQYISNMIKTRLPNTLMLSITTILVVAIIQIPLGISLAVKQNTIYDNIMRVFTLLMASVPAFWLGLMLILLFSVKLGVLPSTGFTSLKHMVIPVICGSALGWASGSRLTRSAMLEVIRQDYIRTARAKGLTESVILRKHALRNAMMPTITSIGLQVGHCFGGSVIIEQMFGINGMGKMLVEALRQKDAPVILGGVLMTSIVISLANLLTDLAYAIIDPRIRAMYMKKAKKLDETKKKEATADA